MGKAESERLNRILTSHLNCIHETLQLQSLDQTPVSSAQKATWDEVIKLGEQVSKNATTAGMLFTEGKTGAKALEENMQVYFNTLQGLILFAHGSTVGAGPTLSSYIHASIKQVVDCSFILWTECVSYYGSRNDEQKCAIPKLVGTVWDACSALKKTPTTNIIAIGRAMTRVAVIMKDVLHEINELELEPESRSSNPINDEPEESNISNVDDNWDDLGKDLSPEEMKIAQIAIRVVSDAIVVIKELIRSITGLLKKEKFSEENGVESLEKLLKLCHGVGSQVDQLGPCLYPPQEFSAIATICTEIPELTDQMHKELDSLNGSTEVFSEGCKALRNSLEMLKLEISSSGFVPQMQNLGVEN